MRIKIIFGFGDTLEIAAPYVSLLLGLVHGEAETIQCPR